MYPNAVERVRGGPARLEDTLRDLHTRVLTARTGVAWSIQEDAGHLLDIEPLMAKRLTQLIDNDPVLHAWDCKNEATWNAEHNRRNIADILDGFRRQRNALVRSLDTIEEGMIERSAFHPRLQKQMRIIDLVVFIAEHDDYHLARITAAKNLYSARSF